MLTVSACSTLGRPESVARSLPPPPSSMQVVPLPNVPREEDPRITAAKQRGAAVKANGRISDSLAWYLNLQKEYAK